KLHLMARDQISKVHDHITPADSRVCLFQLFDSECFLGKVNIRASVHPLGGLHGAPHPAQTQTTIHFLLAGNRLRSQSLIEKYPRFEIPSEDAIFGAYTVEIVKH